MTKDIEAQEQPKQDSDKVWDLNADGKLDEDELRLRDMDIDGKGHISNQAAMSLLKNLNMMEAKFETLTAHNKSLQRMIHWLLATVILVGAGAIGSSIAAARLSKDTSVNSSSGVMTVKDKSTPVTVVGTGLPQDVNWNAESKSGCISQQKLAEMYNGAVSGTPTSVVLEDTYENRTVAQNFALSSTGVGYDNERVYFVVAGLENVTMIVGFGAACTPAEDDAEGQRRHRLLAAAPEATKRDYTQLRFKAFQHAIKGNKLPEKEIEDFVQKHEKHLPHVRQLYSDYSNIPSYSRYNDYNVQIETTTGLANFAAPERPGDSDGFNTYYYNYGII